jgi:hypothetical protein
VLNISLTCSLFVFLFTAQTQVNRDGPETPLKFVTENPSYVLASSLKNTPTYLNCHVSVKVEKTLQINLQNRKFYDAPEECADDDPDCDSDDDQLNQEEIHKLYQQQYEEKMSLKNKTIPIPIQIQIPTLSGSKSRMKRSAREPLIFEWLKDGEKFISSNIEDNQIVNLNGFTLLPNGTLKFQASNLTSGEYRCRARYIDDSKLFVIGPIISKATVVEIPSEFY